MKTTSKEIEDWLLDDDLRTWDQVYNQNCFISSLGEALYVYKDKIRFWEDVRCGRLVSEHKLPLTKEELFKIIEL